MADDQNQEQNRRTAPNGDGGEAHRRTGRRGRGGRPTETASWLIAGAIVVLGGGAAAYLYGHGHLAASPVRAIPTSGRVGHALQAQHPKVAAGGTGASASGVATSQTSEASYPPVGMPTAPVTGPVVEGYGWQYQKSLGLYRDVPGWAFAAAEGTPVRAVLGGRVVANWVDPTEGREVVINSRNGDSIIYGDLESPGPAVGTSVQAGQVFAKVGTPGKLSGVREPHLFLEVTMNGEPQDPATLLPKLAPTGNVTSTSAAKTGA